MGSFSIIDLLLLIGIGQGIFLAISISQIQGTFKYANRYLIQIILLATLMLVGKVFGPRFQGEWVIRLAVLSDTSIFLFGPLLFSYVISLLKTDSNEGKLRLFHYIPAIAHLLYSLWSYTMTIEEFIHFMYVDFGVFLFLLELMGLVSLMSYWIASVLAIKKKNSLLRSAHNKNENGTRRYLTVILISIGLLSFFWLVSFTSLYFFRKPIAFVTYDMMWTITPIFFYAIGFFSLKTPHVLRISISSKRNRLTDNQIEDLKEKINLLINDKLLYKESDLTLKGLAEKLDSTSNDVSWFLNHVYGKSFYDFLNQLRVNAFQEKIRNNEHQNRTLLALAMDVGFKSKSTFNKAFKDHLKITPKDFVKNVDNIAAA